MTGDSVHSPLHYQGDKVECIDAMQAMLTHEEFIGYLRGNIFKYQWRYKQKGKIVDLQKSQWHLDRLIKEESF
jgi:hypothetical protein